MTFAPEQKETWKQKLWDQAMKGIPPREPSREEELAEALVGGLIGLAVVIVLVSWLADHLKVNFFVGLAVLIGIVAALVAVVFAFAKCYQPLKVVWQQIKSCPHGIRAGSLGECPTCRAEADERQGEWEAWVRKQDIARDAKKLRESEIQRLSQAWLSNTEAYLTMSPRQFEDAIADLFRRMGYRVEQTPYVGDGGKDAIAWKDGAKYVIECKRYSERQRTGRRDLQILFAAMYDVGAEVAFFITTGEFTSDALEYARQKGNIKVYDRMCLPQLVTTAYGDATPIPPARVMCLECGATVPVHVQEQPVTTQCDAGHAVTCAISLSDLGIVDRPAERRKRRTSP